MIFDRTHLDIFDYYPLKSPWDRRNKAPDLPIDLMISQGDSFLNITWDMPIIDQQTPSISLYRIYKSNKSEEERFLTDISSQLYFNDTSVKNGETYYYKVSALNLAGESKLSKEINGTPKRLQQQNDTDELNDSNENDLINIPFSNESFLSFPFIDRLDIIIRGKITGSDAALFRWMMDMDENGMVTSDEVEAYEIFMVEFSQWAATQDSGITLDGIQGNLTLLSYEIEGAEGENSSTTPFYGNTHLKVTFQGINKNLKKHTLNLTIFNDLFTFNLTAPDGYHVTNISGLDKYKIIAENVNGVTVPNQLISITFMKKPEIMKNDTNDNHKEVNTENDYKPFLTIFIALLIIVITIIIIYFAFIQRKKKKGKDKVANQYDSEQPLEVEPLIDKANNGQSQAINSESSPQEPQ